MEEMVLAPDRGRESMAMAVGGGGGGGGGGTGGVVGREGGGVGVALEGGARSSRPQPQRQLRRKSVSFTADETFQIIDGGEQDPGPSKVAAGSAGSNGKIGSPVAVAPASTFFLRANRTTSPMVTPHTAYASSFAKKITPHGNPAAAAAAAEAAGTAKGHQHDAGGAVARTASGASDGPPRYAQDPPPQAMKVVPEIEEGTTTTETTATVFSANVTPPQQGRPPVVAVAESTSADSAAAAAAAAAANAANAANAVSEVSRPVGSSEVSVVSNGDAGEGGRGGDGDAGGRPVMLEGSAASTVRNNGDVGVADGGLGAERAASGIPPTAATADACKLEDGRSGYGGATATATGAAAMAEMPLEGATGASSAGTSHDV
ncbi:unnamed protein product, partial [Scytosiphon promiscuus]